MALGMFMVGPHKNFKARFDILMSIELLMNSALGILLRHCQVQFFGNNPHPKRNRARS